MTPFEPAAHILAHFELLPREEVLAFLNAQPALMDLLGDLVRLIPVHFSDPKLFLRVVTAAPMRGAQDGRRLVLFIATAADEDTAMAQMDRLMHAWQPDVRATPKVPFSIAVARGRSRTAVDEATQCFSRAHGALRQTHSDLARRLLESVSGTDEHALICAELAVALIQEQDPTTPRGGLAEHVLARMRLRHTNEQS